MYRNDLISERPRPYREAREAESMGARYGYRLKRLYDRISDEMKRYLVLRATRAYQRKRMEGLDAGAS